MSLDIPAPARRWLPFFALALLAASAACDDETTSARVGSLAVTIVGLPPDLPASVTVLGPGGSPRELGSSETIQSLPPGTYTVNAAVASRSDGRWLPTPPTQTVTVEAGTTPARATVTYALATARLAVTVTGLPAGAAAAVTVTGPDGFSRALTASQTIEHLAPGAYTIAAASVQSGGFTYRPALPSQTLTLTPSLTPVGAPVSYAVGSGTLAVTIGGLPAGTNAAVTVSGPAGFSQTLTASATLSNLDPGTYALSAAPADAGSGVYSPAPRSQTVEIAAGGSASASVTYALFALALQQVMTGLANPVYLTTPAGDARLFVVEQPGRIRVVRNGQLLGTPFLDITARVAFGGERGLLSMAFDPGYATNGFFYVYFTDLTGDIVVERYSAAPGADVANSAPTPVITIAHRDASNHNGGLLVFGPDGMLYLGTGDGGGGGDQFGNGQNLNTLLGKVLRIDVRSLPYAIPPSNPFANQVGRRGEIWAYGLRNPWRFDFDTPPEAPGRADLYIADVGQNQWEEVNVAPSNPPGINYGWNVREGAHCFVAASCSTAGLQDPVAEYDHSQGCSITGGFVYRGTALPEVAGHYFYSDYCQGWLASLTGDATRGFTTRRWSVPAVGNVLSFGEDAARELYVLAASGAVYRIVGR